MSRIVRIYRGETSPPPPADLRLYDLGYEEATWQTRCDSSPGCYFQRLASEFYFAPAWGAGSEHTAIIRYPVAVDLTNYTSLQYRYRCTTTNDSTFRIRLAITTSPVATRAQILNSAVLYGPSAQSGQDLSGTLNISSLSGNHYISVFARTENLNGSTGYGDLARLRRAVLQP